MSEIAKRPKITDPTRIMTLANGLSVLRAFLAFPIVYSLSKDRLTWSVILILIVVISDFLDGFFARRAHEVTNIGKVLDPVADKIVIFAVIMFLALDETRDFPAWFVILYIIRDLQIALTALYIMNHFSLTLSSNNIGKWSIGVSALAIFLYVIRFQPWGYYILLAATFLAVVSWFQYIMRDISFFRK